MKFDSSKVYDIREVSSIREILESSVALYPDNTAFLRKKDGAIEEISYTRMYNETVALATYFHMIGLGGKKIAVMGHNSYEWSITYLAVTCGTGVIVPFDKELKGEEIRYLAADSDIAAIVFSKDVEDKLSGIDRSVIRLPMENFDEYFEKGDYQLSLGDTAYRDYTFDPDAMSVLIYTSGTTGLAKGVMLSHTNIAFDVYSTLRRIRVYETDRTLSILPMHHTYQCMAGFLVFIYAGASIAFIDSIRHLQQDMITYQPTVFIAVPLVLESFLKAIQKKYAKIFAGNAVFKTQQALSSLFKLAPGISKGIFTSVTKAFGGKMRAILCGAASLSPEIYRAYESFGLRVYVGYGLTETAPVSIVHNDFYTSPNDVGYPIDGVEAMLVNPNEDGVGELILRGKNVMLGYYNNPTETEKVLKDGWFYTGDLARINKNGSFSITGRIKSMIVIQSGKKIFPEELEYYLEQSPLIKESLVFGHEAEDGSVQVAASIFPDFEKLEAEMGKHRPDPDSEEYNAAVMEAITKLVRDVNRRVPHYKCIRKIIIKKTEFEKTSTRKIKRIASNYSEE
ncbi:MAG: AMP-binding protein [Clostridia bacterium]|nr:AMP-binding protein [Clostridia bacterium]